MKEIIFRTFIKYLLIIYERIFHEKISRDVKKFLKNLAYISVGTISATVLSFAFNILAGRFLGPFEYGKFSLLQSVAMFLYLPMLLGFHTAMIKYNSEKDDLARQTKIISTSFILVFIFSIPSLIIYYIFSFQLSKLFSVSEGLFYLSIIFAILFLFYVMAISTVRGLLKMKTFALFQPIYSCILLITLLYFIFDKTLSFKSVAYSFYLAYGISAILILFFLRKYMRFQFDKNWAKKLLHYSTFASVGGLSYVFYTNIDKILINTYMTLADVGIYRAYTYASMSIIGAISGIFITVFFPTASKYKNKYKIYQRINKLLPFIFGIGIPFIFISEFIILKLYGENYPINLPLMFIFTITSLLIQIYCLYAWLFDSEGLIGVKIALSGTLTIAISNIFLNILLIPLFGLYGAIGSTAISFSIGLCILFLRRGKLIVSDVIAK